MRLADVIDDGAVKTVTVVPGLCLAEAARAMHGNDATAIIVDNGRFQGILTAGDILRFLTSATSPIQAWQGPASAALGEESATAAPEEPVGRAIEKMIAARRDHLPVVAAQGIVVVSLSNLLLAENAHLHGEVHHLQNYIDALHDAPND